jgi:hypothetical protein
VLEASSTLVVRSPAERLARAISIVGAPPVMTLPMVALAGWYSEAGGQGLMNGALTMVATTAILPCLFVYIAYRAGYVTSPDLPRRSERLQPAVFAALCAVAAYPLLRYVEAPLVFLRLDAALALQLIFLATVTVWWKISYHAGTVGGVALVALAWGGLATALPFVMLALIIGWARVRLGRHTVAQVCAGWASALPACWWVWPV